MAGIGDKAPPRRRRAGLLEKATQDRREEKAAERRREPAVVMEQRSNSEREKVGWYITAELNDQVRDAVAALEAKGLCLPGGKRIRAGALIEPFIKEGIERLMQEHNEGAPFETSKSSKSARKRREKKSKGKR